MKPFSIALLAALVAAASPAAGVSPPGPSRPPVKGCSWANPSYPTLGLAAWVQRCDFGFRTVDFVVKGASLSIRYSDGGAPEPVVDAIDLLPAETPKQGIQRFFAGKTDKALAARCVLVPFRGTKPPAGVERYTFVPDAAYAKELDAKASPDEVGEPPCGEFGDAPDGIQYFEAQPASGARKVLFVRAGQDEPLFDEKTLRLLPAR